MQVSLKKILNKSSLTNKKAAQKNEQLFYYLSNKRVPFLKRLEFAGLKK